MAYENDPIGFDQHGTTVADALKKFVCRHETTASTPVTPMTAGQQIDLQWVNSALHVGDAAVYISYDTDVPMSRIEEMEFFKIANIFDAKAYSAQMYPITLPEWLPSGRATLRWEWYALHNNPSVELYVQCSEIEITGLGGSVEKTVAEIPKYRVWDGTTSLSVPWMNNDAKTLYRDAFNPSVQFMTGPECAFCYNGNDCALSDVGTQGHVDMGTGAVACDGSTQAPTDPNTQAPTDPNTQAPTEPTTSTAAPTNPNTDGIKFYLDSSNDLNTKKSLANIGGLLAQCAWESGGDAPWSACDENNYTGWSTAACSQRYDGIQYKDLTGTLPGGCPVDPNMQMTAETFATWTSGPLQCGPGTETEGCCWWGRGAIQTTGPYNYGRLQVDVIDHMAGMEDVSLCTNPEAICQVDELKFIGALHYWTTVVQADQCFDNALNDYATNFDNSAAGPSGCAKFSMGVGGSINNGNWNQQAHQDYKRQQIFVNYMTSLSNAFDTYDNAEPSLRCTGDAKIDRMLELSNMRTVSGIDASQVYNWSGFCAALRQLVGNNDGSSTPAPSDAPVTTPAPSDAPVTTTTTTTTTPASGSCPNGPIQDGGPCAGDLNGCCQSGLVCHLYSNGWSGCTLPANIPDDNTQAPTDPNTPAPSDDNTQAPTDPNTPAPSDACVDESKTWGSQCGGQGFSGNTCCPQGMECQWRSQWFAGCRAVGSPCGDADTTGQTAGWICDPPAGL